MNPVMIPGRIIYATNFSKLALVWRYSAVKICLGNSQVIGIVWDIILLHCMLLPQFKFGKTAIYVVFWVENCSVAFKIRYEI